MKKHNKNKFKNTLKLNALWQAKIIINFDEQNLE